MGKVAGYMSPMLGAKVRTLYKNRPDLFFLYVYRYAGRLALLICPRRQ